MAKVIQLADPPILPRAWLCLLSHISEQTRLSTISPTSQHPLWCKKGPCSQRTPNPPTPNEPPNLTMRVSIATCLLLGSTVVLAKTIRTKVAILGAGLSGISAAKTLAHHHKITDIVIVDAQDAIGGRLHDVPFAGIRVELGANWIQGLGKNPIWVMAQQAVLKSVFANYSDIAYYNVNGEADFSKESDAFEEAYTAYLALAGKHQAHKQLDISARTGFSMVGWFPDTPAKEVIEYWSFDWEEAEPAEISSHLWSSISYNATTAFSPDNNFVVDQRGYKLIPEAAAALFLKKNDSRLHLNTIVEKVVYSDYGVQVFTNKGDVIVADYAVSTFSVGVLQHEDVKFYPPFPDWKRQAIFQFHMATYTKIFLNFDHQFWGEPQYFLYADPTRRGYYPVWQNLNAPGYFPKNTRTNILLVTVTDAESKRIELQSDEATQAEIMVVLRSMFGHDIPNPTSILVPRWIKNPLFRGSYSNWPAGETFEEHSNLRAPLGRLWFSGEANSADYFGFAHGAWIEGAKAGENVAQCLKSGDSCHSLNTPYYPELFKCKERPVFKRET
ncbi:hypothetical protein BC936DRAFT_148502 [Jimgerdemannia flammicorona]|uniref:Amine oxidase n=1 Tax=Jimgerdemannia flammicorona TaxID=994334 RepID=A0A433DKG8_9FUNG|nr:hypothetical protein BC936DRAFT_148502 [Jimgerdemannia flammicorona]